MSTTKDSKRIDKVTVKRIQDEDGDTSWLGEYSETPNDYAIVATGEHEGEFVADLPCECSHSPNDHNNNGNCMENCECEDFDRIDVPRGRDYRYFSPPVENYEGCTDAEMRQYCQQDYKRMRDYGQTWSFYGIQAEAQILIPDGGRTINGQTFTIQTIHSGGLWGIESDSDDAYFKEVEQDELSGLKDQLRALGFSKRAITAAFRNVEHKDA